MAFSDPLHYPSYLNAALLVYQVSHHCIIGMSPFKALYDRDTVLPSRVLLIFSMTNHGSSNARMRLIANELIFPQALAANFFLITTTKDSESQNPLCPKLLVYYLGDLVLFYQHQPGGRSHNLATTWLDLIE